jgi:hypothetical protein
MGNDVAHPVGGPTLRNLPASDLERYANLAIGRKKTGFSGVAASRARRIEGSWLASGWLAPGALETFFRGNLRKMDFGGGFSPKSIGVGQNVALAIQL